MAVPKTPGCKTIPRASFRPAELVAFHLKKNSLRMCNRYGSSEPAREKPLSCVRLRPSRGQNHSTLLETDPPPPPLHASCSSPSSVTTPQKEGGVSVCERRGLRGGNPFGFRDRAAHPRELVRGRHRDLSVRLDENPRVRNDPQNICDYSSDKGEGTEIARARTETLQLEVLRSMCRRSI